MNHNQLAEIAINEIKCLAGVSKIILFGSVARGTACRNSDVDIAVILDDLMRGFPLDHDGYPAHCQGEIDKITRPLEKRHRIRLHVSTYYQSEYERGIKFCPGREGPPDVLHEVGIVKYESEFLF